MFTKLFVPVFLAVSSAVVPTFSLPTPQAPEVPVLVLSRDINNPTAQVPVPLNDTATRFPDIGPLSQGNQAFRSAIANSSNPNSLQDLATKGQFPGFLFFGCRSVISSFLSDLVVSVADSLHSFLVVLR